MSLTGTPLAAVAGSSALSGSADNLLREAGSLGGAASKDKTKALKAGKDFESLLLGQWLQEAEDTFARIPGAEDEEASDAGASSMQGIAMQSLGQAMSASGGIGIARMITSQLERSEPATSPRPTVTEPAGYQGSQPSTEQLS